MPWTPLITRTSVKEVVIALAPQRAQVGIVSVRPLFTIHSDSHNLFDCGGRNPN
jgi:hypothetical protein